MCLLKVIDKNTNSIMHKKTQNQYIQYILNVPKVINTNTKPYTELAQAKNASEKPIY